MHRSRSEQFIPGALILNNEQGQVVKVDQVYRERAHSDARRKPEPVRWSQTIQRYKGAAGNVTFVDMDRTPTTFLLTFTPFPTLIPYSQAITLTKSAVSSAKSRHLR